jgi:hypothetical protein
LAGATADTADMLTNIVETRDVVKQLSILSKERMAVRSTRSLPIFHVGDLVYLSTRGLHIHSQECKHLRDQTLGSFKVMAKVGMTSLNYCYLMVEDYTRCSVVIYFHILQFLLLEDLTKLR